MSVSLLSHISPLERLFVLKILSRIQRATEVKNCEVFSETASLQRSSTAPLKAICTVSHFPMESVHAHYSQYHVKRSFLRVS